MKIETEVSDKDIRLIRNFVEAQSQSEFYRFRESVNLRAQKPTVTQERFWRALICMRLTSRQKSGPASAVVALSIATPFPLSPKRMRKNMRNLESYIASTLQSFHGMRDYKVASSQMATNFKWLEDENWQATLEMCNRLRKRTNVDLEREVARYLADKFHGIGPKQARNVLQALGLTRYEIPIDSRFIRWLKENIEFPYPINGSLLADSAYYELVSDAIQVLCEKCRVFPCMLDAAIFGENDEDEWPIAAMAY